MRNIRFAATALALSTLVSSSGFAARGKADFTRYVAVGDSYGAGFSSGALVLSHQQYSYPNLIARQAGVPSCSEKPTACFQQPLVSEPGIAPELVLQSLAPLRIVPKSSTNGAPINLALPRPYNNLSIPGGRVNAVLNLTGTQPVIGTATLFAQFILRGLGTAADQASAQRPTFMTVWIGGNDVLGAVLDGTPASLTPLADFTRDYNALLDKLVAANPNTGIVVGSVADVTAITYANTIPPVLINPATNLPVLGPTGAPIPYIADLGGGQIGVLPAGSLVLLHASSMLATGFGIPEALRPLFPGFADLGKPLPDSAVLTPAEQAVINQRARDINAAINAAARARDIPVVNMQNFLTRLRTGYDFAGIRLSTSFLSGGVFSYDGFHPTDLGYALIANEFLKVINSEYDVNIPLVSLTEFFQNNAPIDASGAFPGPVSFEFSDEALANLRSVFASDAPAPIVNAPGSRRRGAGF